jgi:hypothetical protein
MEKPIPNKIFKFCKLNQNFYDMLIQNRLWFSNACDFNDPYDCNVSLNKNYTDEDIRNYWENVKVEGDGSLEIRTQRANEWINDRSLIEKVYTTAVKKMINNIGICCFTSNDENLIMWAHYADSHRGACVEFDSNILNKSFNFITHVKYSTLYPEVNLLTNLNEAISKIMIWKSIHWQDEEEIRIHQKSKGYYPFNPAAIKTITFGIRTSMEQIMTVMIMLEGLSYKNVTYRKVVLDNKSFKISYNYIQLQDKKL